MQPSYISAQRVVLKLSSSFSVTQLTDVEDGHRLKPPPAPPGVFLRRVLSLVNVILRLCTRQLYLRSPHPSARCGAPQSSPGSAQTQNSCFKSNSAIPLRERERARERQTEGGRTRKRGREGEQGRGGGRDFKTKRRLVIYIYFFFIKHICTILMSLIHLPKRL